MKFFAITPGDGRDLTPWLDRLEGRITDLVVREPTSIDDAILRDRAFAVWIHLKTPGGHKLADTLDAGVHAPGGSPRPHAPFGQSCHDRAELDSAFGAGARYAFLSPVFPPTSKPDDTRTPLGPRQFRELTAGRAVVALGGITPERAAQLQAPYGFAVLGDLFHRELHTLTARLDAYGSLLDSASTMNSSGS